MESTADLLIHNVLALGALLVLTVLGALAGTRLTTRVLVPLLRRVDEREGVPELWGARISRLLVVGALLVGLCLLGGAVLASWYEVDTSVVVLRWVRDELLRDPAAIAWLLGRLLGVIFGAFVLHVMLRWAIPLAARSLATIPGLARRQDELELVLARVQIALRWTLTLGALLVCLRLVTDSAVVREPVAAVTYVVVGVSFSRSIVEAAHLVVDVLFELSEVLEGHRTPLRFLGRLQRLANVTKRVLDYFVYVGTATIVIDQVTPDTPFSDFGPAIIRVIAILYVARVVIELCEAAVRESLAASPHASEAERQQRQTLAPIATSLIRYAIYIVAIAMALGELGLDASPILAAAGLLGIAVGLGAQAIVSDLVSGFFILFEGLFLVGHRVRIGEVLGEVEDIGVRVTKIRDELGVLHCIPNGEIRGVASHSQRYVNAVVEFGVPFEEELPRVFGALQAHLQAIRARYPAILDESELEVAELREGCVWLRVVTPVEPGQDKVMTDALYLEITTTLAAARIAPPHTRAMVRLEPDGQRRLEGGGPSPSA
ncbi:mechanosensitive ion channel family protein [Paraliomyxa miuraensis]|uniref:mechanosensitive ion channel family protein n=1 Tax=Paraliomyxa miuraensis TaxID=376150 RepID=UPI00224D6CAC|nr:mechanosensitive ion channel domain-containing protein [Paraliomyxa miuraensis]MCX4242236.1 mechanosensitive ion channel family protein [Paraliomyxa miuraensis]